MPKTVFDLLDEMDTELTASLRKCKKIKRALAKDGKDPAGVQREPFRKLQVDLVDVTNQVHKLMDRYEQVEVISD